MAQTKEQKRRGAYLRLCARERLWAASRYSVTGSYVIAGIRFQKANLEKKDPSLKIIDTGVSY